MAASAASPVAGLAGSGGIAGALALSGDAHILGVPPVFPVWNLAAFLLLTAAFTANIWQFAYQHSFWRAFFLFIAYAGLSLTELWRLPLSHPENWQWAGLALSVPWFIALPWSRLPSWVLTTLRRGLPIMGISGLGVVFALQWGWGFRPCPLCEIERLGLALAVAGAFLPHFYRNRMVIFFSPFFWFLTECIAVFQMLEWKQAVTPLSMCTRSGVSCVHAAGQPLAGIPLIDYAVVFFAAGLSLSLMGLAKPSNR
ncbi:hypothetical protein ACJU26_09315 [Acidithiobacillus sp. M4-SHS-6]|uniref:hypothetical protein n=1 Tax=Acidithiobacillus sp. M4-SHS-6 TaxID=3383024 RepID=UPI0039BE7B7E